MGRYKPLILFIGLAFWSCEEEQPEDCSGEPGGDNICGCTYSRAINYDSTATFDDGSCEFDTSPPIVMIISPQDSSTVKDSITISCMSSDDQGIDKVELWVNGVNTGISDNVEPYSLVWITTAIDDGSYTITVRAYDVSENTADSEPITLIVDRIGEECETYYSEYVTPILSQNCYSCHSGSAPSGGLNLSTYESVLTSMETILDRVNRDEGSSGFMPSGGSKLSVSDLSSLQTFLEMDCE